MPNPWSRPVLSLDGTPTRVARPVNPFLGPQDPNQWNLSYGLQRLEGQAATFLPNWIGQHIVQPAVDSTQQALHNAFQTPNSLAGEQNDYADKAWQAMIGQESGGRQMGRDGRPLTSSKGAIGIAQVMPATAPEAARYAGLQWDENKYKTDPNYNLALGKAYYKHLLQTFGGDVAKATAAYNAGPGRVAKAVAANPGGWAGSLPSETQGYLQNVLGKVAGFANNLGAPYPGFDAVDKGYQQAGNAFANARDAAMKPSSITVDEAPMPQMPAPIMAVAPDTSAGDAAFAQAAPKDPFNDPKEKSRIRMSNALKGMAQAAMSIGNGPTNLGTMLFQMGAGALAGRGVGDDEIRAKSERHEQLMMEYQRALANREDGKAANIANVMNSNAQTMNTYSVEKFRQTMDEWHRNNDVRIEGGNAVTSSLKDGKRTITATPIGNAAEVGYQQAMANLAISRAGAMQQHQLGEFDYNKSLGILGLQSAMTLSAQQAAGSPFGGAGDPAVEAQATGLAMSIAPMVKAGTWQKVVGPGNWQPFLDQAREAAGITSANIMDPSFHPTEAQQELIDKHLTASLTTVGLGSAAVRDRIMRTSAGAASSRAVDRVWDSRKTRSVNPKGQVSMQEVWGN
jgi:hypothetical protein